MKRLFPTLPETPDLGDLFRAFPATLAPILEQMTRYCWLTAYSALLIGS